MADITLVGTAENAAIDGANVIVTLPTSLENDVIYASCGVDPRVAGDGLVVSAGWTLLLSRDRGTACRLSTYRKVMGAVPDTTVEFAGTGNVNDGIGAVAHSLRGVDIATPEDATTVGADGNSTNPDPPAIVTVTDKAWVLSFAAGQISDASVVAPSGYANQVDINAADINPVTVGGATREVTPAGSEDPATWTTWATSAWVTHTVAVRPAGGAAAGQPMAIRGGGVPGLRRTPVLGRSW